MATAGDMTSSNGTRKTSQWEQWIENGDSSKDLVLDNEKLVNCKNLLACPICYKLLISGSDFDSSGVSAFGVKLRCKTCRKEYPENESEFDLTITGGRRVFGDGMPPFAELFRNPLVSFMYEKGWRQGFSVWADFPGPEKEFESIKEYLTPVVGGNIIDASCGSGVFSRLFAKSGLFSLVFALDFSEVMMRQCYKYIQQEDNFPKEKIMLVRADISRLPFATGCVDAVHAGASLHCWPSPLVAVAEISRVLRPGGMFVTTTFLLDGPFSKFPFRNLRGLYRQTLLKIYGAHIFLSEKELEDLCSSCGFVDINFTRNGRFIMISATKPK